MKERLKFQLDSCITLVPSQVDSWESHLMDSLVSGSISQQLVGQGDMSLVAASLSIWKKKQAQMY